MMTEIMDLRSQVLSGNVPVDELKELKHRIAAKIDHGNAYVCIIIVNCCARWLIMQMHAHAVCWDWTWWCATTTAIFSIH